MLIDEIWGPTHTARLQRSLWVEIAWHHKNAGLLTEEEWDCYRHAAAEYPVNLERMRRREKVLRHDLKAALEEFDFIAGGFGKLHLGCTSADIVENVYCIQMRQSAIEMRGQLQQRDTIEDAHDVQIISAWLDRYPMRGIKGAVGSQSDQVDLLGVDGAQALDYSVARTFGFPATLNAIGQIAPRSLDYHAASELMQLHAMDGPARQILTGYVSMLADIATTQWNEGDVSSSVVRRVALPGIWRTLEASIIRNPKETQQWSN